MKVLRYLVLVLLCSAVLVSCKKKAPQDSPSTDGGDTPKAEETMDFKAMATEVCNCTKDMLAAVDKMSALTEAGDTEGLAALATEMEAMEAKVEPCIVAVEAKYPGIDGNAEYEEKAQAALKEVCPGFAKMMEEAAGGDDSGN